MDEIIEDHLVQCGLKTIQGKIRRWARKFATTGDCEFIPKEERDQIIRNLEGYCLQADWNSLVSNIPVRVQHQIPAILVEATLAKHVFDNLFSNPFFALPDTESHPALPSQSSLLKLYSTLQSSMPFGPRNSLS
jgi:hypothetical protein